MTAEDDPRSGPADEKRALRQAARAARRALPPQQRRILSRLAQRHALRWLPLRTAARVGLYRPLDGEVGTELLERRLQARGAEVLYPAPEAAGLTWVSPASWRWTGRWWHPQGLIHEEPLDCAVVPGVSFDRHGGRLGLGGGFYDRWIARLVREETALIGLAFSLQVVDRLPSELHDRPVDALATDQGLTLSERVVEGFICSSM